MHALVIIISWIDDLLIIGNDENVKSAKKEIIWRFECENVGKLKKKHAGYKLDRKGDAMKITQPIFIQNLEDEFDT